MTAERERLADEIAPVEKWDCAIGTPDEDHDWHWVSDWYGDPGVINGTADCSRWVCRSCGKEDFDREPPIEDPDDY